MIISTVGWNQIKSIKIPYLNRIWWCFWDNIMKINSSFSNIFRCGIFDGNYVIESNTNCLKSTLRECRVEFWPKLGYLSRIPLCTLKKRYTIHLHKLSDHFNRHSGVTTKINIKNCSVIVVRILNYLEKKNIHFWYKCYIWNVFFAEKL